MNLKIHEPEGSTHVRKPRPDEAGMGMGASAGSDDIDTSAVDNLVI